MLGAITDTECDVRHTDSVKLLEMALEQAAAAKAQQDFRRLLGRVAKPATQAGGEYHRPHLETLRLSRIIMAQFYHFSTAA